MELDARIVKKDGRILVQEWRRMKRKRRRKSERKDEKKAVPLVLEL